MKIVLILPHDSTYRHKTGTFKASMRYPPITLTVLAGLVPSELNAEVVIVDEGVEQLKENFEADLVGITAVTATAPRAYSLADSIRKRGITVVLGGVHPTVLPLEAICHADSVVIGYAEASWPQLLRDFAAGCLKRFYHSTTPLDLKNLPFPRRDLLNREGYFTLNTIMATRGCPNKCKYCSIPVVRQGYYAKRPVLDVVNEIKSTGERRFVFLDPNPNDDPVYAAQLYQALIPLNIKWVGLTTMRMVEDEKLLNLAVKSGCFGLLIGFETVSQEALCQSHKDFHSVDKYGQMVKKLHDKGLSVLGCFMFGFDTDDKTVFERTLEFIDKTKIDLLRYTVFTPFPGTRVYKEFVDQGRIIEGNWEHYDYEHVVFQPAQMSPEELDRGIEWIWRQTYTLAAVTKRIFRTMPPRWEHAVFNFGFRHHVKKLYKCRIRDNSG